MEKLLSDELLTQALEIYEENRLSALSEEIGFEPSLDFERKMKKLIKSQTNVYYKITLTRARRIIAVAAVIIALLASTLSVGAIRETILSFFFTRGENVDVIEYGETDGNAPDKIEKYYPDDSVLALLPEGWEKTEDSVSENSAATIYSDGESYLSIEQFTNDSYVSASDSEFSEAETVEYGGQSYIIREGGGAVLLIWEKDGYVFEEVGFLGHETMLKIAAAVAPARE